MTCLFRKLTLVVLQAGALSQELGKILGLCQENGGFSGLPSCTAQLSQIPKSGAHVLSSRSPPILLILSLSLSLCIPLAQKYLADKTHENLFLAGHVCKPWRFGERGGIYYYSRLSCEPCLPTTVLWLEVQTPGPGCMVRQAEHSRYSWG